MAAVTTEKDSARRDVLSLDGPRGKEYLHADAVFIRASDGTVMISGNLNQGPLRESLTPEEMTMAQSLPLVKRLSIFNFQSNRGQSNA